MNIQIKTLSQATKYPITATPVVPIIMIEGKQIPVPKFPATSPVGYQAIITGNPKYFSPPGILFNQYFGLSTESKSWYKNYLKMYDNILSDICCSPYSDLGNILILCSYGAGQNIPPTAAMYQYLTTAGASDALTYWEKHCDPGSENINKEYWMVRPVNYILVGRFGLGSSFGKEKYERASEAFGSIQTNFEVTF